MGLNFPFLLLIVSVSSHAVPAVILAFTFSRQPLAYKWLTASLFFSFFCDVAGVILMASKMNPNVSGNLNTIFGLTFISLFFYYLLSKRSLKGPLIFFNGIYIMLAFINTVMIQKDAINSYTLVFATLLILSLCILFFYKLLQDLPAQQLQRHSAFWIVSAFFFTYSGKLVIFAVVHYLIHYERDTTLLPWIFHNFLTIIANILLAYGAWVNHRQLKSTSLLV
jgi:hypothetical protein